MQSPMLFYHSKCNGTQCKCSLFRDYMEINSGLQLMISPMLLSPMLSLVSYPSGGVIPLVSWIRWIVWWDLLCLNCSLKNICSRRPLAFPESCFQCIANSVYLPRNYQTPTSPPSPSPPQQVSRPQRFSAFVAKHTLHDDVESDDGCFTGKEGDESNTDTSDNDSDSCNSDNEVYTFPSKASRFELVTWYSLL